MTLGNPTAFEGRTSGDCSNMKLFIWSAILDLCVCYVFMKQKVFTFLHRFLAKTIRCARVLGKDYWRKDTSATENS